MSTLNRIAMLFTIAVVIKSGRIPTARAMTLPKLAVRQDLPTVAPPPPPAVMSSTAAPGSTGPVISSAVLSSAVSSAPAITSQLAETASSITPTTSTVITSTIPSTFSIAAFSSSASGQAISNTATSTAISGSTTLSSSPSASSTLFSEELSSPLPKPNYAPGGMAFILPAFVVIGLIFIIWLIYKTKEYIWKLKEAEEMADTQSPDLAKPPAGAGIKGAKSKEKGGAGGRAVGKIGGGWKKKGWKELDSASEDEKRERRDRDRYSRVDDWQGSRKYRSRDRGEPRRGGGDPYERSRGGYGESRESWDDRDRRYRGDDRGGYGRVRPREAGDDSEMSDQYDRREFAGRRPSRRSDRNDRDQIPPPTLPGHERPPPQRAPKQDRRPHTQPISNNPNLVTIPPQTSSMPAVQAPATALGPIAHPVPSRPHTDTTLPPPTPGQGPQRGMSRKEKKGRAEEWIKKEKEWNEERHHLPQRREIAKDQEGSGKGKGRERVPDAYEDEFEERYTTHLSLGVIPQGAGVEGEKGLNIKMGEAGYTPVDQGAVAVIPTNPYSGPSEQDAPGNRISAAVIPTPDPRKDFARPTQPHSPPAYMRARAISPPPILSPPMNPNLFFHVGPSTTELVPLSTYDSATDLDLESTMTPIPPSRLTERESRGDKDKDKEHVRMPSIPSTAEKLERSGTSGPGRTVRKVGTPTNSRVIVPYGAEKMTMRTKSHDPTSVPGNGPRADVQRTPTRRGTDTTSHRVTPTIRLIDSRGGSLRRTNTDSTGTPQLSGKRPTTTEGLTPKRYSKRVHPAAGGGAGTPESTRKVRAQRKEQKARGKVDEILRDSWIERAVVSPVGMEMDDDEEEDNREERKGGQGNVPNDEVEVARARSRATSPSPAPRSPPRQTRPLSPRKAPAAGITQGGESVQDVAMLQGIEQRMALMKELENRARKAAERGQPS